MQLLIFRGLCAYKKGEARARTEFCVIPVANLEIWPAKRPWVVAAGIAIIARAAIHLRSELEIGMQIASLFNRQQSVWVQLGLLRLLLRADLARSGIERPRVSHGFWREAPQLEIRHRNDGRNHGFCRSVGPVSFCRSHLCRRDRLPRRTRSRLRVSRKEAAAADASRLNSLPRFLCGSSLSCGGAVSGQLIQARYRARPPRACSSRRP